MTCRKRPIDDTSAPEFDSAMSNIFHILMNVSKEFLYRSGPSAGVIDESNIEFAEYICESMVSLGSTNLQCIAGDSTMLGLYLQQVTRTSGYMQKGVCCLLILILSTSNCLLKYNITFYFYYFLRC